MPAHHDVRASDVITRRLHGTLAAAAERGPADFAELLLVPGVGARTVESLAMVAEVVHGAPCRFSDPARFSLAHGGKDRHPFPVPLRVYDETIRVLKSAVRKAALGRDEELAALKRLDDQARQLEMFAGGPSLDAHIAHERERSPCAMTAARCSAGRPTKAVKDRQHAEASAAHVDVRRASEDAMDTKTKTRRSRTITGPRSVRSSRKTSGSVCTDCFALRPAKGSSTRRGGRAEPHFAR